MVYFSACLFRIVMCCSFRYTFREDMNLCCNIHNCVKLNVTKYKCVISQLLLKIWPLSVKFFLDTGRSKYFVGKPCFRLHFELTDSWRIRMSNLLKIGTGSSFFSFQSLGFSSLALVVFVEFSFTKGTTPLFYDSLHCFTIIYYNKFKMSSVSRTPLSENQYRKMII